VTASTVNVRALCAEGLAVQIPDRPNLIALQTVCHHFNIYAGSCVA